MSLPIRALGPDDLDGAWAVLEHAFGGPDAPEDRDVECALADPKRFYGAYDGDRPVATGGSFALDMTIPGGTRPMAGVTWIGVQPTHRRRGLLTSLMGRLLQDLHDAGEPVACLWASEGAIYQRFGYGPAAWHLSLTLPTRAAFTRPVVAGDLRLVEPDRSVLSHVYDVVAARTPGWYSRSPVWWDYRLFDPTSRRSGASPLRAVLADGPNGVEGYALYATKQDWSNGASHGTVHVREVVAIHPETRARLWRYLLDLDLMSTVRSPLTATDEPLLHLLAEPRAATPRLKDNLWVRLVDVPAGLASRCYATGLDVVLDVLDEVCPWNAGRWRLSGDATGATCTPTAAPADLQVRAADLGAGYLGGTTLTARAGAGHLTELTSGSLAAASVAFGWPGPAPFCPMVF
ncbi:MAG: GNAT family N-acetyltransferase [Mycobacteriales bacterium]